MKRLYFGKGLLGFALIGLLGVQNSQGGAAVRPADAESSPLFDGARENALATMAARDVGLFGLVNNGQPRALVEPGTVILVAGTRWYDGAGTTRHGALGTKPKKVEPNLPTPADITTDISCTYPTMFCPNCLPTRTGAPTCVQTCVDPGPTCMVNTCAGGPTCEATYPTCVGATCYPAPTCVIPTCNGTTTCNGAPTCVGTCAPAGCPTTLFNVSVPQAGQIQLSFSSSAQLKYTLQYCTNLSVAAWAEAYSTNGTGGVLTLSHTNGAAVSLYRLLIQTP